MAVSYSAAKSTLAAIASQLSTEATSAGLTTLSSSLTSLSTEITSAAPTPEEFWGKGSSSTSGGFQEGSAALIWSQILNSASQVIHNKINNTVKGYVDTIQQKQTIIAAQTTIMASELTTIDDNISIIKDKQTIIADETITIDNHLDRIQSVVMDYNPSAYDTISNTGTFPNLSGPHFRMAGSSVPSSRYDLARAMMLYNLKTTKTLNEVKQELNNPTPLVP